MSSRFEESHPALAGFSDYYDREIGPWLAERDILRRTAIRTALLSIVLSFALAALLVLSGLGKHDLLGQTGYIVVIIGAVIAIGGGFLGYGWAQQVKDDVKAFLMGKICGFLGLHYSLMRVGPGINAFRWLSLIPHYDHAYLEDEILGDYENVSLQVLEADLTEEHRSTDSDGNPTTEHVRVFGGLLMRFTFPKPFRGTTILTQDRGWLGNFFGKLAMPGEKIALEDPRFESVFEVYGSDQVEARYLLTPTFMERILALSQQLGQRNLRLAFEGELLLISLRTSSDQFEAGSMLRRLDDPQRVQTILNELSTLFQIIDTLNLNTKTLA